jgi:hypothetical protein
VDEPIKREPLISSRQELAEFYGVSSWTLERWLQRLPWPGGKLNGRFRCTREQALAYLERLREAQSRLHPESPSRLRTPEAPGLVSLKGR